MKNTINYSKLNEYLVKNGYKFNGAIAISEEECMQIDYIHPKSTDDVKKVLRLYVSVIDFEANKYDFDNVNRIEGLEIFKDGSTLTKVIEPDFNDPAWQRFRSEK